MSCTLFAWNKLQKAPFSYIGLNALQHIYIQFWPIKMTLN